MDPRQYYSTVYNLVLNAARERGVAHPEALAHLGATQSAHETQWGKHAPGNNYFGIKGGNGPALATREVINGRTVNIRDHFRSYPNMQASANDYVKFLQDNPRYKGVLNSATAGEAINAQAHSGYATDPIYGRSLAKIHSMGTGGRGAMPSPAPVLVANQSRSTAFKKQFGGPAPVQTAAATPQQRANPQLDAAFRQKPASTILEKLSPISTARASEDPSGLNRDRINSKDPSGPLLPAPVQTAPATSEQRAAPRMDPTAGSSYQDVASRMRQMWEAPAPMQNPTLDKLGLVANPLTGGVEASQILDQNKLTPLNISTDRSMLAETPYSVSMQQAPLTSFSPGLGAAQLPPIDVGAIPQGPGNNYQPATPGLATSVGPFVPDQEAPMVTPLTQETPPSVTPETYADPGPSFTPDPGPSMADSMPSVGGEGGGGGDMMSGLMDALSNLGGGGEGAGQQMPNPTSQGGPDALTAMASMPDFPHMGDQYGSLLQQRGSLVNQLPQQEAGFSLRNLGQAGQMQQDPSQSMGEGFARSALKRLFTA